MGVAAAVAVGVTGLLASGEAIARRRTEQPSYVVEADHGAFEVRRYAPRIVAEVEVEGSPRAATRAGFRILADFIFGNNEARQKVAMTAPVEQRAAGQTIAMTAPVEQRAEGDRWVITFTMPSKYTLETLPEPVDDRIVVRQRLPQRYAVVRFSGAPSPTEVEDKTRSLLEDVQEAGLVLANAPPIYARYDPPWTLPPLRRNEILVPLADNE